MCENTEAENARINYLMRIRNTAVMFWQKVIRQKKCLNKKCPSFFDFEHIVNEDTNYGSMLICCACYIRTEVFPMELCVSVP